MNLILAALIASIFPLASARAQVSCQSLFLKTTIYDGAYNTFKQFDKHSTVYLGLLKSTPEQLSAAEVEITNKIMEMELEQYFDAAGIEFQAVPSMIEISGLKDQVGAYPLPHKVYKLRGTKQGDELSRMLNGVQTNDKFAGRQMAVYFDLYYNFKKAPGTIAHFNSDDLSIHFSPSVMTRDFLGLSAVVRHEIGHYLEHIKTLDGEMTLARLKLRSAVFTGGGYYSKFLSVDEIETWLRELRVVNRKQNGTTRETFKNLVPPEGLDRFSENLDKNRENELVQLVANLRRFITNATATIQAQTKKNQVSSSSGTVGDRIILKIVLKNAPYEILEVELTGLITIDELADDQKRKAALDQVFSWTKHRIQEVEQEIRRIRNEPPPAPKKRFWDFMFKKPKP